MFGDFMTLVMDQVVNQAAKIHYMSGGRLNAPLTVRTTLGATRRSAAQHSQSLHAWVAHIPGVKVALPATPADAKGLLKAAIRDDNPVVVFEDKMNYAMKGPRPDDEDFVIPLGVAEVKRAGEDVTIIATSSMVYVALDAARSSRKRASRRGRRPAHARAARPRHARRVREEDRPRDRRRRGPSELRRLGRARRGRRGMRLLAPRRAGAPARGDGRPDPVLASARRRDRPTPERVVATALDLLGKKG
jgi:hypothetical protein